MNRWLLIFGLGLKFDLESAETFHFITLSCQDADPTIRFEEVRCCPIDFACSLALDRERLKRYRYCNSITVRDLQSRDIAQFTSTTAFLNTYLDLARIVEQERITAIKNVISEHLERTCFQKENSASESQ